MMDRKPEKVNRLYFLITIDTEGDNLWAVNDINQTITTRNAEYLFRFQELCEKYGFVPTYLTNYEMSRDNAMIEMGRRGLSKGSLEIGSHEHAWNQPPFFPLIKRPFDRGKPYLGEYPPKIIREKLQYLTKTLEDTFGCKITSHRGGRWCLNQSISEELIKLGYVVDCTCTPGISWTDNRGWTVGSKGADWSLQRNTPYVINTSQGSILEVPVSIERISGHKRLSWLRPNGRNKEEMIQLIDVCSSTNNYVEFMIHSSELMEGGSPLFEHRWEINRLYESIEALFKYAQSLGFRGIGLSDFALNWLERLEIGVNS